jgi:hypothetical protein
VNGDQGISRLTVTVNGKTIELTQLKPNEVRVVR